MFDDDKPIAKARKFEIGQALDDFSVAELDDTIALLRTEIERLAEARENKASHLGAAEALFSKPG